MTPVDQPAGAGGERERPRSSFDCVECQCPASSYMVSDALWFRAMPVRRENSLGFSVLCLDCLEKLVGFPLTLNDFSPSIPANVPIHFGAALTAREVVHGASQAPQGLKCQSARQEGAYTETEANAQGSGEKSAARPMNDALRKSAIALATEATIYAGLVVLGEKERAKRRRILIRLADEVRRYALLPAPQSLHTEEGEP